MNASTVDRPIFFVGMPRSGTTLVFEAVAAHEDLAWLSQHVQRAPVLDPAEPGEAPGLGGPLPVSGDAGAPFASLNFSPFHSGGLWLAVMLIPPAA